MQWPAAVKVASARGVEVEGRVGGGATLIKTKIERTNPWRGVWRKYVCASFLRLKGWSKPQQPRYSPRAL